MTTTLAIREDQIWWTQEQADVLKQGGIEPDVTTGELRGFLHLCQRTQLDPFARQIYLIGRYDRRAGRKVYTPQTGIDGYRLIAQRTCERKQQTLSYDDTLWCGTDGQWVDVWLGTQPPAAAKVTVYRDHARFSAVALWHEYAVTKQQDGELVPSGLWGKMPAAQLAKCAEALVLRKAFPNDMAGIYTAEEMQQADQTPAMMLTRTMAERADQQRQQEQPAAQVTGPDHQELRDQTYQGRPAERHTANPTGQIPRDEWTTQPQQPAAEASTQQQDESLGEGPDPHWSTPDAPAEQPQAA